MTVYVSVEVALCGVEVKMRRTFVEEGFIHVLAARYRGLDNAARRAQTPRAALLTIDRVARCSGQPCCADYL